MTPKEYIEFHKPKPLSQKEIDKGKEYIKISGTDEPIPWDEVYTRIAAGMSMEHVAHIYGQGRKIALWAVHDNVVTNDIISEALDSEIEQRRRMDSIAEQTSPEVAATIHEMANEYAPDVTKTSVLLSKAILDRALKIAESPKCTSLDLQNISRAHQTTTDILGLTQRHASAANNTTNHIAVSGFTFALDAPPEENGLATIDTEVVS